VGALLATGIARAQIHISPTAPSVTVGGSVILTADRPVTYSLKGVGSLSSPTGTSIVFSAPPVASIPQPHILDGCMVLPSDAVYNTRIDTLPVNPNTSAWVSYATANGIKVEFDWGTNLVDSSTPTSPQFFHYTRSLDASVFPIPALPDRKRQGGASPSDSNNDHHMIMLNQQSCTFHELYQSAVPVPDCPKCTAASGWTYTSTSYDQPRDGTTDAAGMPITPLTIHLDEIEAGHIAHALRFTACAGCISRQWLWPATYSTGGQPGAPPMGARFRLRSGFDVSKYPRAAQVVLVALKEYGMFLSDIGLSGTISGSTDLSLDPRISTELNSLINSGIKYTDFEVVDETSLMVNAESNRANPNNPYVQPNNSAVIHVVDAANPQNVLDVPIAVKPITVGTADPALTVQAGTPGFPIKYWVGNSTNQQVRWSLEPSVGTGSISPDGIYTAPISVPSLTKAVLTLTSTADSTAATTILLNILPSGTVRIDSGSDKATQDEQGNAWLPDLAFETGSYSNQNDWYPITAWGQISQVKQFQTYKYTWGDDIVYRMHVPNGTYNITLMFGLGNCTGTYSTQPWDNGLIWGRFLDLEVQGMVAVGNWDMGAAIQHQCRTPQTVTIPAVVVDTSLLIAVRATALNNNEHSATLLNGLVVSRDSTQQSVPPGSTDTSQKPPVAIDTNPEPVAGAYAASRPITIDHGLVTNSDQTEFPVLVSGVFADLATSVRGGLVQNPNGYDIVFASDAAGINRLNFERSAYDPNTGQIRFWVRVPVLSHTRDTVIYMLYGNAAVVTDQQTIAATWNDSYAAVWHMDETSGTVLHDSTGNANDAIKMAESDPAPATGLTGGGQAFTNTSFSGAGNNLAYTGPSRSTDIVSGGLTITASIYPTAWNVYGGIYKRTPGRTDSLTLSQVALTLDAARNIDYWVNGVRAVDFPAAFTINTWACITVTHDFATGVVSLFRNGALVSTGFTDRVPLSAPNDIDVIGNRAYGLGVQNFPGMLDEVSVSHTVRSSDWIMTQYNNQVNPATFYAVR
jgi:hypothetical protein